MAFGIDFAGTPPSPSALKGAGVKFVCRYLSTPGNPKNITRGEADALRLAGIDIVLVFETTAKRVLAGRAAGGVDAKSARDQARLVGLPDAPIYFAVDFDAMEPQQADINGYLAGAAAMIGWDRVGVYGGYYVVQRALDRKACRYAWQTYAWSGGKWDPRAHIQQYRNGQSLCGITVDFDRSMQADFGQAKRPQPVNRRRKLRAWVLTQRVLGVSWPRLKTTSNWKLWRRLGGH